MDDPNHIDWQATFCSCRDHDIWCITYVNQPTFLAVVMDRLFDAIRVPRAVPATNVVWVDCKPGRREGLDLRTKAMQVLGEVRKEFHRSLAKGWQPSFIIGSSFNATFTDLHHQQPSRPPLTLAAPRTRP